MAFYAREKELSILRDFFAYDGFRGAIVYGRRRIGKSALIKESFKRFGPEVSVVYYQCVRDNLAGNVARLTQSIEAALGLSHLHFDDFEQAVGFLFEQSRNTPIWLAIDEYPFLSMQDGSLDSQLQRLIDTYDDNSNLKLILSGSSVAMMERILSEDNPLYRRFRLALRLEEMDYYDAAKFMEGFSDEDKIRLYAAFGGSPYFLQDLNHNQSVSGNIKRLLTDNFLSLQTEVETNLSNEVGKIENANAVFQAIASGAFHFNDILGKTHLVNSTVLSQVLDKLQVLGLVVKTAPINDPRNKKKSGYRIKDKISRFYYRYLFPNQSANQWLEPDVFYAQFIEKDFELSLVPHCFEEVGRQFLARRNNHGLVKPLLLDLGTLWYDDPIHKRNGEFDVVGRSDKDFYFLECKFISAPVTDQIILQEAQQVADAGYGGARLAFLSRSGYSLQQSYPYDLFTLKDIFDPDLGYSY